MKAVYAGSFDPFTNGHLYILTESIKLFEEVHIIYAMNNKKIRYTELEKSIEDLKLYLKENNILNKVKIIEYKGLIAEYCKENSVDYNIRGLRDTSDYLYEENISKINKEINPNLKTIYIRANNDVISSSMVRELHHYGKDISKYVPFEPIFR